MQESPGLKPDWLLDTESPGLKPDWLLDIKNTFHEKLKHPVI